MSDEKYITFKRAEYEEWLQVERRFQPSALVHASEPEPINDAVVIRTQDIFAAAGLNAYALNIRTYIGGVVNFMPEEMVDKLLEVADYFAAVAQEAEDRLVRGECKVPD